MASKIMWTVIAIFSNIIYVENRMIPLNYLPLEPITEEVATSPNESTENENPNERVLGLRDFRTGQQYGYELEQKINDKIKKPCSIVVLSNIQRSPQAQSLLRRYRYDANGILIPSSVKYFMKLPQGFQGFGTAAPILVPLKDKAFSPLGGFVRYYKEVPPIPQSW